MFILALIAAFAFDLPKGTCTAPVAPVCFNPAVPGSSFCSSHQPPPAPKVCAYYYHDGNGCLWPAKSGSDYCGLHSAPPADALATCTAPVVPVCFNPAKWGSSYCASHQGVPEYPSFVPCQAVVPPGQLCGKKSAPGKTRCADHAWPTPPLTDSIPK